MGRKGFVHRRLLRSRLLVLAALWAASTIGIPAASVAGTPSIGRTSSASMTISVDVVPRFTLTSLPSGEASSAVQPMPGKQNELCFESNSTMPFTVAQENPDGSWMARPTTVAARPGMLWPAACVTLAGRGSDQGADASAPTEPGQRVRARTVTLLIAPL